MRQDKKIFLALLISIIFIIFIILFLPKITNHNESLNNVSSSNMKEIKDILRVELANYNQNEYSISHIQQLGGYTLVLVDRKPKMGQNDIVVYAIKEEQGKQNIVSRNFGDQPKSLGVSVYKMKLPNITVVYGGVSDQVWLNPNDSVTKVDFTEVKVLYSHGEERSMPIKNFQTFMICLEGDVYIDDVLFLSKDEVVNKLSILPIGENNIDEFNK